jgi:hypothetical protein
MNNIRLKNYNVDYDSNDYINIIPKKTEDIKTDKILIDNNIEEISEKNKNQIKNENDIYEDYKDLKKEFNNFLENVLIGTTKIKNLLKKIDKQMYKNEIIKIKQINKKNVINKDRGFAEEKIVPKSIQIFFDLEQEVKMSRTKIGGLFQDYLKKNNLKGNIGEKNKIDKRIYKLDNKLAKLFGVSEEQMVKINSCTSSKIKYPNGYNFHNYQTWIKKIYDNENNSVNINI